MADRTWQNGRVACHLPFAIGHDEDHATPSAMTGNMLIGAAALSDILAHARAEAPRECCGLLVGTGEQIVRSVRATNLDASPTRYSIDPADHFRAIRAARADGLDVVGAYHSHPAGAPVPSATDIAEANSGADFLYLIVSLVDDDVRAYRIDDGKFIRIPLQAA